MAPSMVNIMSQKLSTTMGHLFDRGIGDITGPVIQTNMMGYANLAQTDTGLHMRQRARAAIIAESTNSSNRIVFLNLDTAMGDSGIRRGILAALEQRFPGVYNENNVAVVGTHQHSGVGGFMENLLPQLTSFGFVNVSNEKPNKANISSHSYGTHPQTVLKANINRSPSAYLNNPAEERARYEFDQDKELSLLRFDDVSGNARGFLSFFAVHGTSLYENNTLVSGDNKGMAAYLAESAAEPDALPGQTEFVALFSQALRKDLALFAKVPENLGMDNHALLTVRPAEVQPRVSDFHSNYLIGLAQYEGAQTVMNGQRTAVSGNVRSVHQFVNMANYTFALSNGTEVTTCPAALGFSFAGGTSDGPGAFDFIQGINSTTPRNPFWDLVKGAVTPLPSKTQIACQFPKPILLNIGFAHKPYAWSPSAVHIQILRVGQVVILVVPGEFTTMAGRRMREAIRTKLIAEGVLDNDAYVVIAGPANTYALYVTTIEEYAIQRYEGAGTLFGPHANQSTDTLEAYMDIYSKLTGFIADNVLASSPSFNSSPPPDLTKNAISLQRPVVFDAAPFGKDFGQVLVDVRSGAYYSTGETVSVQFVGANPRNNLRLEETFLTVEKYINNSWIVVRTDSHPSTTFEWVQTSTILGTSAVTVNWTIESGTSTGSYRIRYFGDSKPLMGSISSFNSTSGIFMIA
ncbi:hypothetical protein Clacol_004132 [Clathrus columnatus]|uniref:Neutral ceramidase n=1 Tax=Clathrus columnatus TaxID=1419009 RepID=A0AAV5A9Q9_9AGAM|nr:hypothetical protein Clacol_004132 [Clathrus columnatus]